MLLHLAAVFVLAQVAPSLLVAAVALLCFALTQVESDLWTSAALWLDDLFNRWCDDDDPRRPTAARRALRALLPWRTGNRFAGKSAMLLSATSPIGRALAERLLTCGVGSLSLHGRKSGALEELGKGLLSRAAPGTVVRLMLCDVVNDGLLPLAQTVEQVFGREAGAVDLLFSLTGMVSAGGGLSSELDRVDAVRFATDQRDRLAPAKRPGPWAGGNQPASAAPTMEVKLLSVCKSHARVASGSCDLPLLLLDMGVLRHGARLVVANGLAGSMATPGAAAYASSRAWVGSFWESVRSELGALNERVGVSVVGLGETCGKVLPGCPTALIQFSAGKAPQGATPAKSWQAGQPRRWHAPPILPGRDGMSPDEVAKRLMVVAAWGIDDSWVGSNRSMRWAYLHRLAPGLYQRLVRSAFARLWNEH